MPCIAFTGGGTAGHVTPNIALIEALQAQGGWDIHYFGTEDGMERKLITAIDGVTYHAVPTGKLRRYFDVKNLTDPFRVIAGSFRAARLIGKLKPALLFSKGGFVSVPVVYGAKLHGVPIIAHESDMTPGLANKLCAPLSRCICTSFPEAAEHIGKKAVFTGTPMRKSFFSGTREKGLQLCGFTGEKPVIMMTGGSTGAKALNETLRGALPKLLNVFDVVHLCGKGNVDDSFGTTGGYRQFDYVAHENMPSLYAAADVIISRSGSNTLCEIMAMRKPALFIPYPKEVSRGDQVLNAQAFEKRGMCRMLEQSEMTVESLTDAVIDTYKHRREIEGTIIAADFTADGTDKILELIQKYARK